MTRLGSTQVIGSSCRTGDPDGKRFCGDCGAPLATVATAIAVGRDHAYAVIGGGTVRCWGENEDGRLGDGSPPPTIVTVLAGDD